jgi:CRISPR/Cas system-associated exonuclease Cas4 (RecB family)
MYRQENAPEENTDPEGIFWTGQRFEEDVIVPYLQDAVVDEETYVRNSMWIDITETTNEGVEVRFKGATDPVVVTRESEPVLVTEVKTKDSVDGLSSPNRHHRAQVHAYVRGLSESDQYEQEVQDAVIIYGSRTTLDVKVFEEPFDPEFWAAVVRWAGEHTDVRKNDSLPAAVPEYDWECEFCSYKHRCGQSDEPYRNWGSDGLLPHYTGYPREKVAAYLQSRDDALLPPPVASEYPELATQYGVMSWACPRCGTTAEEDVEEQDHSEMKPSVCRNCASEGELVEMQLSS